MTQERNVFPVTGGVLPTLGQGFNSLSERLLKPPLKKPSTKVEDYTGDTVIQQIKTTELQQRSKTLAASAKIDAAFMLTLLAEISRDAEQAKEQIAAFLVIIMPLRIEQLDGLSMGISEEEAKKPDDTFFQRGDSHVHSVTFGNYLFASLTSDRNDQKAAQSGKAGAEITVPKASKIGAGIQVDNKEHYALTKHMSLIKTNRPDLLSPGKDEIQENKDDLDSLEKRFEKDAKHYWDTTDRGSYRLHGLLFQTRPYETHGVEQKQYKDYLKKLRDCRARLADVAFQVERYSEGLRYFDSYAAWPKEDNRAQLPFIEAEQKASQAAKDDLAALQRSLSEMSVALEVKEPLSKERLGKIVEEVNEKAIFLMEKKETFKQAATRRLIGTVVLPAAQKTADVPPLAFKKIRELARQGTAYFYMEVEGNGLGTFFPGVYEHNGVPLSKGTKCFTLRDRTTFIEADWLTALQDKSCFAFSDKTKATRPAGDIQVKIYAIHKNFGRQSDFSISLEKEDGFTEKLKEADRGNDRGDVQATAITDQENRDWQRIAECERQWSALREWRRLTVLPKRLAHPVERKNEMEKLRNGLGKPGKNSVQVIIHGMGGVGKTQLALEYAYEMQEQERFEFVLWVHADLQRLGAEWETLGKGLSLELKGLDENSQRRLVRDALGKKPSWLLVLDNLENEEALRGLLPEKLAVEQQVLITSRSEHWGSDVGIVPLSLFTPPQSEAYFKDRLPADKLKGTEELATHYLVNLPLALSHAVAYMQQHGIDGAEYIKRYQQKGVELFGKDLRTESTEVNYTETVLTTWLLSMEQLEKKNEQAAQLVKLCGYLHPDGIPEVILKKALELKEDTEFDGCISAIKNYSLLSREAEGIKIHRLVQGAIRYHEEKELSQEQQFSRHLQPLGKALSDTYPDFYNKTNDERQLAKRLEPHIKSVSAALRPLINSSELKPQEKRSATALQSDLLLALGNIVDIAANFKESKHCCEQALALRKQVYGEDSFETASALVSMGDAEWELGEYKKAEGHYLASLAIREKQNHQEGVHIALIYRKLGNTSHNLGDAKRAREFYEKGLAIYLMLEGEERPSVATMYNNLGIVYETLGEPQKALELYEKALAIGLKVYGDVHPDVADRYNNVGSVYQTLGDARKSLEYHEKALGIHLKVYGDAHPNVADSYSQLGSVYQTLGDARKSLEYHEKALGIRLKVYGDAHPNVADSYSQLGSVYQTLGDARKSLEYHEKALGIRLKVYGDAHPNVADSYSQLGSVYQTLGDARKSLEYHEKALGIRLKVYGDAHPNVADSYSQLGSVYDTLGDARKSLEYHEKALGIRLKVYGDAHPNVATSYSQLGSVYQTLGDARKSLEYHEKALGIRLKVYGDAHPNVADSYSQLGSVYDTLGDARKSLEYHEKALGIRLKVYGDAHPNVATSYSQLGSVYQTLGDARKSLEYHEKALGIRLKVYGDAHPNVADSYSQLGSVYDTLGDAKKSLEYHEKALGIRLKVYGDTHPDVASSYLSLGNAYALQDVKRALGFYEKELAISLKMYGEEHPNLALSYGNLGVIRVMLGNIKEALTYQEKSLAIHLKTYGEKHPHVAINYNNLGNVYEKMGETTKAIAYFEKSIAIYLKVYDENHPDIAKGYSNLGRVYQTLGNTKKAIEHYKKSLAIYQKLNREEYISEIRSSLENLEQQQVASERKFQPVVPVPLPWPPSPKPPVPVPAPRPQPTTFSSYVSFFRNNPGKAALVVGGGAALVALAYTYLKKPGGGIK